MNKPTQEKIKKFWEWCGFKYQEYLPSFGNIPETREAWLYPDGSKCFLSSFGTATGLPDIDLNNIVKYAVPKLKQEYRNWKCPLHDWVDGLTGDYEEDSLALFRIIEGVIDEN